MCESYWKECAMATLYELSEEQELHKRVDDLAGALKVLNAVVSPTSTLHHTAPSVWEDRRY